jgi:hypothetical protein
MTEKELNKPGPLGHHYGIIGSEVYSPYIPEKEIRYSKSEPIRNEEVFTLECGAIIQINHTYASNVLEIVIVDPSFLAITTKEILISQVEILLDKKNIPQLIQILKRLSLEEV